MVIGTARPVSTCRRARLGADKRGQDGMDVRVVTHEARCRDQLSRHYLEDPQFGPEATGDACDRRLPSRNSWPPTHEASLDRVSAPLARAPRPPGKGDRSARPVEPTRGELPQRLPPARRVDPQPAVDVSLYVRQPRRRVSLREERLRALEPLAFDLVTGLPRSTANLADTPERSTSRSHWSPFVGFHANRPGGP